MCGQRTWHHMLRYNWITTGCLRLLKIEVDKEENLTVDKMRSYEEKSKNCQEKALQGEVQKDESRRWFRNAFCKKDTECMILAAQEKAFLQILSSSTLTKYQILHCVDWAVAILKPPQMQPADAPNFPKMNTKNDITKCISRSIGK